MVNPVDLACKILSLPEGLDHIELQKRARLYIKSLSGKDYELLKEEALIEKDYETEEQEYAQKLKLFKQLCFTDREARAYARMRVDSPGVRRVIARRALLMKLLNRRTLVPGTSFYAIANLEDKVIGRLSHKEIMKQLGVEIVKEETISL